MATAYHVYANTGAGDPINYAAPVATVTSATTWSPPSDLTPGTWSYGVRAYDTVSGDEEQNLDASVTIVIDVDGRDVTDRPAPPTGTRAMPIAGGSIRVEWYYPPSTSGPTTPTGFNLYCTAGATVSYAAPAVVLPYSQGLFGTFQCDIAGLVSGQSYSIGVRAYNAVAEEPNTYAVAATADSAGPLAVDSLVGAAIV